MLKNIMEVPLDVSPLHINGVGVLGIKFVQQVLRIDPLERPTAAECLYHPWISQITDVVDISGAEDQAPAVLAVIQEEDEDEQLDASQLSLHDAEGPAGDGSGNDQEEEEEEEEVSDVEEIDHTRLSKRQRLDRAPFGAEHSLGAFAYPSLPVADVVNPMSVNPADRLFGEIGASDLRSSGVLSHGANVALDLNYRDARGEGSYDQEDASDVGSDLAPPAILQHHTTSAHPYYSLPAGSTPSLMGAEGLIRQLNMASPESAVSAPVTPGTPRTPASRRDSVASSSAITGSKRASQVLQSENHEMTPKRPRVHLPESLAARSDGSGDSTTHNVGYRSRPSARDNLQEHGDHGVNPNTTDVNTKYPIASGSHVTLGSAGTPHPRPQTTSSPADSIQSSVRSATIQQERHDIYGTPGSVVSGQVDRGAVADIPNPQIVNTTTTRHAGAGSSARSSTSISSSNATGFIKPATRLGKLVALPGSIVEVSLNLEKRHTSYGRDPQSTYVYPDSMDTRIPKSALDILFWRSGIEDDLKAGADWLTMTDLSALISTRCNRWIKVNDVRLCKAEGDGWLYGILKHGDIITIFDGPSGFLKFRAEFYVGLSRITRAEGEKFHVEKEVEKFIAVMSRHGSPATSEKTAVSI